MVERESARAARSRDGDQRAALLGDVEVAEAALGLLDRITVSLGEEPDRKRDDVRVLRQALGYCWSVAIVAAPRHGRATFERLVDSDDPEIRSIVRANLRKGRLRRLDPIWVRHVEAGLR